MEDTEGNKLQVNDIWEVIYTQRAIRYWSEEPIPRELIEKIIESAYLWEIKTLPSLLGPSVS